MREPDLENLESKLPKFEAGEMLAGRRAHEACIQVIADKLPSFIGGSADLSCSDSTTIRNLMVLSVQIILSSAISSMESANLVCLRCLSGMLYWFFSSSGRYISFLALVTFSKTISTII